MTKLRMMPALLVFALVSSLMGGGEAGSFKSLRPFQVDDPSSHWDKETAIRVVEDDVETLLARFEKERGDLEDIAKDFDKTRVKDDGIRKLAQWGAALSRVYELPGIARRDEVAQAMEELAELLLDTRKRSYSYIEDRVMRGWPMFVDRSDDVASYEGFNAGWIATAVSLSARAVARRGDDSKAAKMLMPVLEFLWDGFFTSDIEMSKLDDDMRVVYVPKGASAQRQRRQLDSTNIEGCLDVPQAYNHGLLVARAAIAALRAMDEINWKKASWTMYEWSMEEAQEVLGEFIRKNAEWFLDGMEKQEPTGDDKRDMYPGGKGADWYVWKYKDVSKCSKYEDTFKDRPQDIGHAPFEISFMTDFRTYVKEGTSGSKSKDSDIFDERDVRAIMVTFLNRMVDYSKSGGRKFACDLTGITEKSKWGYPDKQCGSSRNANHRPLLAPAWLELAANVHGDDMRKDKELECDALRMVNALLPMTVPGEDDYDKDFFGKLTDKWGTYAIQAKYYFYNYKTLYEKASC